MDSARVALDDAVSSGNALHAVQEPGEAPHEAERVRLGWKALLAIFLAALALRLLYLVACERAELIFGLFLDSRFYAGTAAAIRAGEGAGDHPYLLSPLYPYWLALFPGIESDPITHPAWWPRIWQAFLGSGTCCAVARLGAHLGGRRVALLAGWLAVVYGPLIHHDVAILVAGPQAFFLTLAVLLATWPDDARPPRARWLMVGLALGVGCALRPTVLAIVFAFAGLQAAGALLRRDDTRQSLGRAGQLLAGALLVILPFSVRNLVVSDQFVLLSANGGMNFWIGNHQESPGVYNAPPGRDTPDQLWRIGYVRQILGEQTTHAEASRWWWELAWKEVRANPAGWVRLLLRKAVLFFHPVEIPQLGWSFEWYRDRTWPLWFPLQAFHVLVLALAAPLLLFLRGERATLRLARWPVLLLVTYASVIVAFFITARYRIPIMPVALALAALSLVRFYDGLVRERERFFGRTLALLSGCLGLFALGHVAFAGPFASPVGSGIEEAHYASYLAESGRFREAAELYPKVFEGYDQAAARVSYAEVLRALGRREEARAQYETLLERDSEDATVWFNYGNLLWEDFREGPGAEQAYRRSIALRDEAADVHFNLGVILLQQRRFAEAKVSIERALALSEGEEGWLSEAPKALAILRERISD